MKNDATKRARRPAEARTNGPLPRARPPGDARSQRRTSPATASTRSSSAAAWRAISAPEPGQQLPDAHTDRREEDLRPDADDDEGRGEEEARRPLGPARVA